MAVSIKSNDISLIQKALFDTLSVTSGSSDFNFLELPSYIKNTSVESTAKQGLITDPFTGREIPLSQFERELSGKGRKNTKRAKLEKDLGLCYAMTLCSKPTAFNDDGSIAPGVSSLVLDRCVEFHKDLLPTTNSQNRTSFCSLDIDIKNMTVSNSLTRSCCGLADSSFEASKINLSESLSKDIRNVTLIELLIVMIILTILSVVIFVSMTSNIDNAARASQRDFENVLRLDSISLVDDFFKSNSSDSLSNLKDLEIKIEALQREESEKFYIPRFCELFPNLCENGMISMSLSNKVLNQTVNSSSTTGFNFPFGFLNISENEFETIVKNSTSLDASRKLRLNKEKLEQLKLSAAKTASSCIQSLICSNPDAVFESNNEKIKQEFLSSAIDSCLKEVVIKLAVDIKDGEVCNSDTCAAPCDDDNDCSNGRECDSGKKICIKPGKCGDDGNCSKDETCDNGTCDTSCNQDDDCNSGKCDTMVKVCIPTNKPKVCTRDDDCDGKDETCDSAKKVCTPKSTPKPCKRDDDCNGNSEKCGTNQVCAKLPITCSGNTDCRSDQLCDASKCLKKCISDTECSSGLACNKTTGKCETKTTSCISTKDCSSGQLCNQDKCKSQQICQLTQFGHNCPSDQFCYPMDSKCWNINCVDISDCPPTQHICSMGICKFMP